MNPTATGTIQKLGFLRSQQKNHGLSGVGEHKTHDRDWARHRLGDHRAYVKSRTGDGR